jgi:hypothetical protein
VKSLIHAKGALRNRCAETNGRKDNGRIQTETIESDLNSHTSRIVPQEHNKMTYIKSKPGIRGTKKDLEVLPFAKEGNEVAASGFGSFYALDNGIGVDIETSRPDNVINVLSGLFDIAFDIHGETRGFRNGEPEVEGNNAGNAAQTDK